MTEIYTNQGQYNSKDHERFLRINRDKSREWVPISSLKVGDVVAMGRTANLENTVVWVKHE